MHYCNRLQCLTSHESAMYLCVFTDCVKLRHFAKGALRWLVINKQGFQRKEESVINLALVRCHMTKAQFLLYSY